MTESTSMTTVHAHIPLTIALQGRVSEDQYEQLNKAIAEQVLQAIRRAQAQLTTDALKLEATRHSEPPREKFDPERFDPETGLYTIDAYRRVRPEATQVALRYPGGRLDLYAWMAQTRRRYRRFRGASLGELSGNMLTVEGQSAQVYPVPGNREYETLSLRLGPGLFYFEPVARQMLLGGQHYEIQRVLRRGQTTSTQSLVATDPLSTIPQGILVYSTHMSRFAPIAITARQPRDTAAIADEVAQFIQQPIASSGLGVFVILEQKHLTHDEMIDILDRLKQRGPLADLLNLITDSRFRAFLRDDMRVPWDYIFNNYEESATDILASFTGGILGAIVGIGEALVDTAVGLVLGRIRLLNRIAIAQLIRSLFENGVLRTLFPTIPELYEKFKEAVYELHFFLAGWYFGRALGYIYGTVRGSAILKEGLKIANEILGIGAVGEGESRGPQIALRIGRRFRREEADVLREQAREIYGQAYGSLGSGWDVHHMIPLGPTRSGFRFTDYLP